MLQPACPSMLACHGESCGVLAPAAPTWQPLLSALRWVRVLTGLPLGTVMLSRCGLWCDSTLQHGFLAAQLLERWVLAGTGRDCRAGPCWTGSRTASSWWA